VTGSRIRANELGSLRAAVFPFFRVARIIPLFRRHHRPMRSIALQLSRSKAFELFIIGVIMVNCALIGVETYGSDPVIHAIQTTALWIFLFEIIVRWVARENARSFFTDSWNVFDVFIVAISFIPESWFASAAMITTLRVLRVFRVLRLLRTANEVKLIISVLFRSFSALSYNALFFLIFMYLFAIIGITLFQLPDPATASPETLAQLEVYKAEVSGLNPYGDLGETSFTLFRVLTGDAWTDLRYHLIKASKMGLIEASPLAVTIYHVLWFILSVFLLLNLLVGAIINNYQIIMDEHAQAESEAKAAKG
jgi:voltage-gated sodium channel